jgi:hypothetical protein
MGAAPPLRASLSLASACAPLLLAPQSLGPTGAGLPLLTVPPHPRFVEKPGDLAGLFTSYFHPHFGAAPA